MTHTSFTNTNSQVGTSFSNTHRNNDNKLSYDEAVTSFFVGLILDEKIEKFSDMASIKVCKYVCVRVCVCVGGDTELKTLGDGNLSDMATVSACACLCVCMYVCIWMPAQGA